MSICNTIMPLMNVPGHFSLQGAMKVSGGSGILSADRKVMILH